MPLIHGTLQLVDIISDIISEDSCTGIDLKIAGSCHQYAHINEKAIVTLPFHSDVTMVAMYTICHGMFT